MSDDFDEAKRRNQSMVREQRRALGLGDLNRRGEEVGTGLAHVVVYLSQMTDEQRAAAKEEFGDDWTAQAVDDCEKALRDNITGRGAFVDRVTRSVLANGDVEVRAEFTKKRAVH